MTRKFITEGPDKRGRIFIIEVDEDKSTSTRNVIRFVCEVSKQDNDEQTKMVTDLILDNLNSKNALAQAKISVQEAKFKNGEVVVVNNQFMAIVFSSFNLFTNKRSLHYRIIVDPIEITHRLRTKNVQDFEKESDAHLYKEDLERLLNDTDQVCLIECSENELTRY